jgi:hypothetical protein
MGEFVVGVLEHCHDSGAGAYVEIWEEVEEGAEVCALGGRKSGLSGGRGGKVGIAAAVAHVMVNRMENISDRAIGDQSSCPL